MTKLLTHAEYQAIAQDLNLPCNAFIDGKFQAARSVHGTEIHLD
jgi:hypothetical protein